MNINELFKIVKKYKLYILIFVVILVEALFVILFLPSTVNKIGENIAKKDVINLEIIELNTILDSLANLDKENLNSNLSKASAALPDQKKTAGLVTGLTNLALTSGATVKNLEFAPGLISTKAASMKMGPGPKAVDASMTVIADLNSLVDFLSKINKASQLLGVSDLQFTNEISSGSQAKIGLYIYYLPLDETKITTKQITPPTETENKVLEGLSSKDIFILQ